ncbi:hypothetical protein ACO2Q8_16790 [Larkinella sp. VNQ87]|uniref:hypothetical protein n=1 Tax=Larkinella sp. VNQ87 TaxID=3400921 RepID=UPI003C052383
MKAIHFIIDLRSFFLGCLTIIGILLLANFTPSQSSQPEPAFLDARRYQAVTSGRETIILDTKTGRFIVSPNYSGKPRWHKGDFEAAQNQDR